MTQRKLLAVRGPAGGEGATTGAVEEGSWLMVLARCLRGRHPLTTAPGDSACGGRRPGAREPEVLPRVLVADVADHRPQQPVVVGDFSVLHVAAEQVAQHPAEV